MVKIKMDLKEIEQEDLDWIHLAQVIDKTWTFVSTVILSSSVRGWIFAM
jgi:hypothetical protein